ncbi:MAG TPA: DUF4917 family protein [Ignavibacteria bacterium]
MKNNELKSYADIVKELKDKKRTKHLLLGNGFSMAYDKTIFSYNALSNFIMNINDPLLQQLFKTINTKNFESIMAQLDNFIEIAKIFSTDKQLVKKIQKSSETLKNRLIEAVKELHPEHVFKISDEKSLKCASFLKEYLSNNGKIFSTNYDLLLYWVLMRNKFENAIDGFGRDVKNYEEKMEAENLEYSELRWGKYKDEQSVYYLHGALPIFDTGIEIVKEEYDSQQYLLEKIKNRMENKDYPIFVTAGNAKEKLNHIMHNKYLSFCYDEFSNIQGSLIVIGFGFGEFDNHIIDAINKAAKQGKKIGDKLFSIYIGIYSDDGLKHIENIKKKFKCKVNLFNAKTTYIWE